MIAAQLVGRVPEDMFWTLPILLSGHKLSFYPNANNRQSNGYNRFSSQSRILRRDVLNTAKCF